jgi:hypothetical protein
VLDIAAQDIAQSDDICPREFIQTVALSIMRIDAWRLCPPRAVFGERGQQRKLRPVSRPGMQNKA